MSIHSRCHTKQSGCSSEPLGQINTRNKQNRHPSEHSWGRNWKQWLAFPNSNAALITLAHTHILRYAHTQGHNNRFTTYTEHIPPHKFSTF